MIYLFILPRRMHLVRTSGLVLLARRTPVVLIDGHGLPRVADPDVADGASGVVSALVHHVLGQGALLLLVLVLSIGNG